MQQLEQESNFFFLSTFNQFRRTGTKGKDLLLSCWWGNLKLLITVVCNMLQKKNLSPLFIQCLSL